MAHVAKLDFTFLRRLCLRTGIGTRGGLFSGSHFMIVVQCYRCAAERDLHSRYITCWVLTILIGNRSCFVDGNTMYIDEYNIIRIPESHYSC